MVPPVSQMSTLHAISCASVHSPCSSIHPEKMAAGTVRLTTSLESRNCWLWSSGWEKFHHL